jgi:8-oxo-dGTP pyrophosphatase MutT (NUDIX family)
VFRSYREALAVPGALGFTSAGVLARLPISMLGIGIVLLVESSSGSYGLAGAVSGTFGLVQALASPRLARAVDRFGQARVMLPAIAVHLTGLALLLIFAGVGAPDWLIFAAAILAGASFGSLGALVRARWSFVLSRGEHDPKLLDTAYSLESVLDEVVYVSGPLLITLLAVQLSPTVGLITAAAAVGIGGTLLMSQRGTEPVASGPGKQVGGNVLRDPGMIVLVLAMTCVGAIFGSIEVLVVAFADEHHQLGVAGSVLACFAFGSLLAGLVYGTIQWQASAGRRFRYAVVVLAAGLSPVLLVRNLLELAVVAFVAGFAVSPMLISGMALVRDIVDATRLTEGLTWVASSIGIGVSAGAAIAGAVVDAIGARHGFVVPVASGASGAVIVLIGGRWLQPKADSSEISPGSAIGSVIDRVAARVILTDPAGRTLLFLGGDPARPEDGSWWFTPGGGVEPGESIEAAARREILEETGFVLPAELGPIVLQRTARFSFEGLDYKQAEHYFQATIDSADPLALDPSGWTETERRTIQTHRWWSADELRSTGETFYPAELPDLLDQGVSRAGR